MTAFSSIPKYVFIVPYRNREEHKTFFDYYMRNKVLQHYDPSTYFILYVHQKDERNFNRGAMKNIGFIYVKDTYPNNYENIILIFNDVDTLPYKEGLLDYDVEDNEIKHFYGYKFALGGILCMTAKTFEKINGYPNYWSWGYEDNVLQKRANRHNIAVNRSVFYDIHSYKILHFVDDFKKLVSHKNYVHNSNKNYNEPDGIDKINGLEYEYNVENKMLDVTNFTSFYKSNDDKYFVHQLNYGTRARVPGKKNLNMNLFSRKKSLL